MAQNDTTNTGQDSRRRVTRTDIVQAWNGGAAVTQSVPDNVGLAQHQIWWNSSGATAGTMTVWVRPAKSAFFVPVATVNIVSNPNACLFLAAIIDDVQLTMSGLTGTLTLASAITSVGTAFTPTGNRSLVDRRRFQVMEVATGWNGAAAITSNAPDHAGYSQHQFAIQGGVGTVNILGRPVGGNTYVNINTDTVNIPASGAIVIFPGMYDAFQIVPNGTVTGSINAQVISIGEEMFLPVTPWQVSAGLGYVPANDALVVHLAGSETITGQKTFTGAAPQIAITPSIGVQPEIVLTGNGIGPAFVANKTSANGNNFVGQTNGLNRWNVVLGDGTAETGSNVGSNFAITRYSDAGAIIDTIFTINRATGVATYSPASGVLPQFFVTGNNSSPEILLNKLQSGLNNFLVGQTNGVNRWYFQLGDSTAESGSNAGSNFAINCSSDAGALLFQPLTIIRATGVSTFNANPGQTWNVSIVNTGSQGAGLHFVGDGSTTPSKTIRARVGGLEFINDAFNAIITSMSDAGAWNFSGSITANNNLFIANATSLNLISTSTEGDFFLGFSSSNANRCYLASNSTGLSLNGTNGSGAFAITWIQTFNTGALRLNVAASCAGNFTAATDNSFTLGGPSNRWTIVYATTGTINTSDARDKTAIAPLTAAEIEASKDLIELIGTYQFLQSIADKSIDDARQHVGLTVQSAMQAMTNRGLDPTKYGFICYDQWAERTEIIQAEMIDPATGNVIPEVTQTIPAGDKYGFRTDELLFFMARGLDARLAAIEAKLGITP